MTAIDPLLLEQLSAWMDGALPPDEARFLQRRLGSDVALREQFERWQVASACLKRVPVRAMDKGFADRVAAATAPAANHAQPQPQRPRLAWLASAAALVVAAVMLPGILAVDPSRPQAASESALAPTEPALSPMPNAITEAVPPMSPLPSVRDFPLVLRGAQAWPRSPLQMDARDRDGLLVRGQAWPPARSGVVSAPPPADGDSGHRAAQTPDAR
ncbi:MAG: sigma-E factor negative regulatory protein [Arenimonas sp.]|uniref:sigma-E factor negative regulatory protein n=1 Tax=Arenimonas sp. TaxID=1872635 RepID=UPI0025BF4783|nr:sigma-E factor negative regulatory protein [Arenimonas sp.]MBW8368544.1 sigma-E factor negative regulatory protein [Arenimonas sp.]